MHKKTKSPPNCSPTQNKETNKKPNQKQNTKQQPKKLPTKTIKKIFEMKRRFLCSSFGRGMAEILFFLKKTYF